jgi:hypothetical protein
MAFSIDREVIMKAIRDCRSKEDRWPEVHLLWELHPFVDWLCHRLLVAFQRREAPVVVLRGALEPGEALFLMQGEIPNLKGQPAVHAWFGVDYRGGVYQDTVTLAECLKTTEFGTRPHANAGVQPNLIPVQSLVSDAVTRSRVFMSQRRTEFVERYQPRMNDRLKTLLRLKAGQLEQLSLRFPEAAGLTGVNRSRKNEGLRHIDRVFEDHATWVKETMSVDDRPYIRIAALFLGEER